MTKTLIYVDPDEPTASLELLGAMGAMYGPEGSSSYAFCPVAADEWILSSFDYAIQTQQGVPETHDVVGIAACIEELQRKHGFDAILVPATTFGRMLAPRAAMRLHAGLVADVTAVRHRNGRVEMVRPAFSGRMLASVVAIGPGPVIMTVRRNVFSHDKAKARPATILRTARCATGHPTARLVERREKPEAKDIRDTDVLVSGGGGVLRFYDRLESLAEALGGMVCASRKVVDSGKARRRVQVGQSGKTVHPRLYLALGISGSIQHIVGMRKAEYLIAVNSDRRAPICALSDIVVEGDAREFIDRLLAKIASGAREGAEA